MKRYLLCFLLLLALLPAARAAEPPAAQPHGAYMDGLDEGLFAPRRSLTRAETAALLEKLEKPEKAEKPPDEEPAAVADEEPVAEPEGGTPAPVFPDVPENAWYAPSVARAAAENLLSGYDDGTFRPNAPVTRAELVTALVNRFQPEQSGTAWFSDLPAAHWASGAVSAAVSAGWVRGYGDGTFRPEAPVTRAEAAALCNAALGRDAAPSLASIQAANVRPFADVRPEDWFYGAVIEAATDHEAGRAEDGGEVWNAFTYRSCGAGLRRVGNALYALDANGQFTSLSPGFQTIGEGYYYVAPDGSGSIPFAGEGPVELEGNLYCQRADGSLLRGGSYGVLTFDESGRYTCGDAAMDAQVRALLARYTAGVTGGTAEKLRAAYNGLRDECRYLSRAHHERGSVDWLTESASFWFANRKGNCYCYAAVFLYLSRQLGYQAQPVSGGVGPRNADHAWVMIDGRIYDPEYEHQKGLQNQRYNLFALDPAGAPFPYIFPA